MPDADQVNFGKINLAARASLQSIVQRWLPDGRRVGAEYIARNPTRADRHMGSFKINLTSGRWADFATGDAGGDPVSLAAYLGNLSQRDAAIALARMLRVSHG
jgi:hypothetical protein